MTLKIDLMSILDYLSLSKVDLSREMRVSMKTVNRWMSSQSKVPGPVLECLRCWILLKQSGESYGSWMSIKEFPK